MLYTLKEQSDQGLQFYKRLKPIFFKEVGFCPPCQIKQWACVQRDIVQWAFVLVAFCPSGLLSVPRIKYTYTLAIKKFEMNIMQADEPALMCSLARGSMLLPR